jgi:hypothetical protein
MDAIYLNGAVYWVYGQYRDEMEEVRSVLHLRLNQRAEVTVQQGFGSVEGFQKYLNENQGWMFQQQERRHLNGRWVTHPASIILLSGNVKLVLSKPILAHDGKDLYYYNRIITVLEPHRNDRVDALAGREVTESIEVERDMPYMPPGSLTPTIKMAKVVKGQVPETAAAEKEETEAHEKPEKPVPVQDEDRQKFLITPTCPKCHARLVPSRGIHCQGCGVRLPDELAVHQEVVVAIRPEDYRALAVHLKQELNVAWKQLIKGRRVEKICSLKQVIFLISLEDEVRSSTLPQEKKFDELLAQTQIGRLTADQYEIREVHKMLTPGQPKSTQ